MIRANFSLKNYNTFAIDAKAVFFATVSSIPDLQALLVDAHWKSLPKLVLGGGSNILFTQDYPGLVISTRLLSVEKEAEDDDFVWIKLGAGENWHDFVKYCIQHQYYGVENLSLIPGTVGAAPIQNIGAYGVELKQVFERLDAVNCEDGHMKTFNLADCEFGYRDSIFKRELKQKYIIVSVTLRLSKKPNFNLNYALLQDTLQEMGVQQVNLQAVSNAVIKLRRHKLPDPNYLANAGSFFKNPEITEKQFTKLLEKFPQMPSYNLDNKHYKIPAAWLIEQCDWKGKRVGAVGVHQHHALVLVNYGGGTGMELQQLATEVQASVMKKFAIQLIPEVQMI